MRKVFLPAVLALALPAFGSVAHAAPLPESAFTDGVASGDVTPTRAIL